MLHLSRSLRAVRRIHTNSELGQFGPESRPHSILYRARSAARLPCNHLATPARAGKAMRLKQRLRQCPAARRSAGIWQSPRCVEFRRRLASIPMFGQWIGGPIDNHVCHARDDDHHCKQQAHLARRSFGTREPHPHRIFGDEANRNSDTHGTRRGGAHERSRMRAGAIVAGCARRSRISVRWRT